MKTIILLALVLAGLAAVAVAEEADSPQLVGATGLGNDLQQWKLDLARQEREQGNMDQARMSLASIMESHAPDAVQREALLELASVAEQCKEYATAQQIYAQFEKRYPEDPHVPEALLKQGLLYREMGVPTMSLSKFYAVMTTVLNLKLDFSGRYKRLVLQAQTEIADTYYLQGKYAEAAEYFERLRKLDSPGPDKSQVHLKLIRCLGSAQRHEEAVREAQDFLSAHSASPEEAEVRFLLAVSLQRLGQKQEAIRQALQLVQSTPKDPAWRKRVGNEVANGFYNEGDYSNALAIYLSLMQADSSPAWQLPLLYQVAITYEHMRKLDQASATYALIETGGKSLGENADPSLKIVLDMARWRKNYLAWQSQAVEISRAQTLTN